MKVTNERAWQFGFEPTTPTSEGAAERVGKEALPEQERRPAVHLRHWFGCMKE
jgi:hypothetical protein